MSSVPINPGLTYRKVGHSLDQLMNSAKHQPQRNLINTAAQFASVQFGSKRLRDGSSVGQTGSFPSCWIGAQRQCLKVEATRLNAADSPQPEGRGNKRLIDARPSVSPWQTDHSSIRQNKEASPQPCCQLAGISALRATLQPSHRSWHKHVRLSPEGIHRIPGSIRSPPYSRIPNPAVEKYNGPSRTTSGNTSPIAGRLHHLVNISHHQPGESSNSHLASQ